MEIATEMADLEALKKKRASVKGWVTRDMGKLDVLMATSGSLDMDSFNMHWESLVKRLSSLEEIQCEIESWLDQAGLVKEQEEEAKYYDAIEDKKLAYMRRASGASPSTSRAAPLSTGNQLAGSGFVSEGSGIQLASVSLPSFDGTLENYQLFWDIFDVSVHSSTRYTKAQKFVHLKNSLKGKAADTMAGWSVSDDDYDAAVKFFQEVFGDKADRRRLLLRKLEVKEPILTEDPIRMRDMLNNMRSTVAALKSLGVDVGSMAESLKLKILDNIPPSTQKLWYRDADHEKKTVDELIGFLLAEVKVWELSTAPSGVAAGKCSGDQTGAEKRVKFRSPRHVDSLYAGADIDQSGHDSRGSLRGKPGGSGGSGGTPCVFCDGIDHSSVRCKAVSVMPYEERKRRVSKAGCCYNCLGMRPRRHCARDCSSWSRCQICRRRHHTLLHPPDVQEVTTSVDRAGTIVQQSDKKSAADTATTENKAAAGSRKEHDEGMIKVIEVKSASVPSIGVLLPVVSTFVMGSGFMAKARVLLDSGSTATFVTRRLAEAVRMEFIRERQLLVSTFGTPDKLTIEAREVRCSLQLTDGSWHRIEALAVPELGIRQKRIPSDHPLLKEASARGITIGDDLEGEASVSEDIHVLIGSDLLQQFRRHGQHVFSSGIAALETTLGWTLHGRTGAAPDSCAVVNVFCGFGSENPADIEKQIAAWWEIEDLPTHKGDAFEAEEQMSFIRNTIKYDGERYQVPLLWRDDRRPSDNREEASRQCDRLIARLEKKGLMQEYDDILSQYRDFGAIEDDPSPETPGFYLPHHPVIKPEHDTHKMRIVINGSAKSSNKLSLNDCLHPGYNLLRSVFGVLLLFRAGAFALTGDLVKAFFTVGVREEDRGFLRMVWNGRRRFCRVPFGLTCAPYLLAATILFHLSLMFSSGVIGLEVYQKIRDSLYMDDLVASFPSLELRTEFRSSVTDIFARAGMQFHKWRESGVALNSDTQDKGIALCAKNPTVLGLQWAPESDVLLFRRPEVGEVVSSKRRFLSLLSSIFDPLGFISPVLVTGKILLQAMWRLNLGWNQELPAQLLTPVSNWIAGLQSIEELAFPRCLDLYGEYDVVMFVDASEKAYAAVMYVVSKGKSMLACSKTRVVPLKQVSLPRLELMAAVLGTNLYQQFLSHVARPPVRATFLSDSQITLAWLKGSSFEWNTFVGNRVSVIQKESSPSDWFFIPGRENAADIASRGVVSARELLECGWMTGPKWLVEDPSMYRKPFSCFNTDLEKRKSVLLVQRLGEDLFARCSSWMGAVKAAAWFLRWKRHGSGVSERLSFADINEGELAVVRCIQGEVFGSEIAAIGKGDALSRSSSLWRLNPFLENGVLKVGGRLEYSNLWDSTVHPPVLPGYHRLVRCLVREVHCSMLHSGLATVMVSLRRRFWILNCKRVVSRVKFTCPVCTRYDSRVPAVNQCNAPLPSDRVTLVRGFSCIGVDFAGPVVTSDVGKVYIALFVCTATRALHCEVTRTLETKDFLLAFERFCARYGLPRLIRSDNGATFRKASQVLKGIVWKFNPPSAPWWGGFFEIFVKLLKVPLRKTLGNALVSVVELETLLCKIVSVVNQRPLSCVSDDPSDPLPLTPANLIGLNHLEPIDHEVELSRVEMTRRLRYLDRLSGELVRRWKEEYVTTLMHRSKNFFGKNSVAVGDLGYLVTDAKSRALWPLAKVLEVYQGKDGLIRVVKLQVRDAVFVRPIQKFIRLELSGDELEQDLNEVPIVPSDDVLGERSVAEPVVPSADSSVFQKPVEIRTRSGRIVKPKRHFDL